MNPILGEFVFGQEGAHFKLWLADLAKLQEDCHDHEEYPSELCELHSESGSPVFAACVFGWLDILRLSDRRDFAFGSKLNYREKNSRGSSVLYLSARHGHLEVLKFLMMEGASLDDGSGSLGTPLGKCLLGNDLNKAGN